MCAWFGFCSTQSTQQESEAHLQLSAIAKHFDGLIPEPDDLRRTRLALARGALCAACKNPIDAQVVHGWGLGFGASAIAELLPFRN